MTEQHLGLRQPVLGIIATVAIMVLALGFIALFSEPVFGSWVAFLMMCVVPVQIICGLVWAGQYPVILGTLSPAKKGLLLSVISLIGGLIIAAVILSLVAQQSVPPGPQHNIFIISYIVAMFWLVAVLQCEPFASLIKQPLLLGIALLIAGFIIASALFYLGMNFKFLAGAPFYQPHMDGNGLFSAFDLLTTMVTSVATIMAFILLDFAPVRMMPGSASKTGQIIWAAILIAIIAIAVRAVFVQVLGFDQVVYMTMVPIPFIFGAFIILNLFEASLFDGGYSPKLEGLVKGLVFCLVAAVLSQLLYPLFTSIGPMISGPMASGAEAAYQLDFWSANAMLAVCFPLIVAYSDFFNHWPLRR